MTNQNYLLHIFVTAIKACNNKNTLRMCHLLNFQKYVNGKAKKYMFWVTCSKK